MTTDEASHIPADCGVVDKGYNGEPRQLGPDPWSPEENAAREKLAAVGDQQVVIQHAPGSLLPAIVQLASDPRVDVTKLEAILLMQERMEAREATTLFHGALARLQANMPRVKKNGTIDLRKGRPVPFAKYEDVMAVVGPMLAAEGFTVSFSEGEPGPLIRWVATWRAHGHTESNTISLPPDTGPGRNELQARGSTNSYAKRYLVEDFLNIVREGADDDGHRGGVRFIDGAQCRQIEELLAETKSDRDQFLAYFGASDVATLEQAAFVPATNMLNIKLQRMTTP